MKIDLRLHRLRLSAHLVATLAVFGRFRAGRVKVRPITELQP
jgi:hypothetical protein